MEFSYFVEIFFLLLVHPLYNIFHGLEHGLLIHGLLDIRRLSLKLLNQYVVGVDHLEGAPSTLIFGIPLLRFGVTQCSFYFMHVIWRRGTCPRLACVIVSVGVQKVGLQGKRIPQTVSSWLFCFCFNHIQVGFDDLLWDDAGAMAL